MHPLYEVTQEHIEKYGHTIIGVFPTKEGESSFAYTIGLYRRGDPELFVDGLPIEAAKYFLNIIAAGFKKKGLSLGEPCFISGLTEGDYKFALLPAKDEVKTERTVQAGQFFGHENYKVMQVIMCDRNHRFPWQFGYDHEAMRWQSLFIEPVTLEQAREFPSYNLGE